MKPFFLLLVVLLPGMSALSQESPAPIDLKANAREAREVCLDQLVVFFAILKKTSDCNGFRIEPVYDVVDSNCIIETSSKKSDKVLHHPVGEYIEKLNAYKCRPGAPYVDFNFDCEVDRNSAIVNCIGNFCSVDVDVIQTFRGTGRSPQTSYEDVTRKRITFKVFKLFKKIKAKIIYVAAGRPRSVAWRGRGMRARRRMGPAPVAAFRGIGG
jgi:hypothetical protein